MPKANLFEKEKTHEFQGKIIIKDIDEERKTLFVMKAVDGQRLDKPRIMTDGCSRRTKIGQNQES